MAKLKCSITPASYGELVWNTPDDVVEVPDADAAQILCIPHAGFSEVTTKPRGRKVEEAEPAPVDEVPAVTAEITEDDPEVEDASA